MHVLAAALDEGKLVGAAAAWPDGSQPAAKGAANGDEVRLVSIDTGQQLTIIDQALFPAFSPNGSQIVYSNSHHKLSTAAVPSTP